MLLNSMSKASWYRVLKLQVMRLACRTVQQLAAQHELGQLANRQVLQHGHQQS